MRRLASIAVFLAVFTVVPLAAQNDSGHVFLANYWKANPGQAAAYNNYIREYSFPYWDEMVRQGVVVSLKVTTVFAGNGEYTHVFIAEYENWDAMDDAVDANAVCQAVFGMTCSEKQTEVGAEDLAALRTHDHRDVWFSARP